MFATKLYWFKDDSQPVEAERSGESVSRAWAAKRSAEVQGHCEVLQYGAVIADYKDGVDVLSMTYAIAEANAEAAVQQ